MPHRPRINLAGQPQHVVQRVNRVYNRSGSVWKGLYKASLIQVEAYLLTCYCYIELNPVRADMVRDPGEYRWSSYRWHGLGASNELITDLSLYTALGSEATERRATYRAAACRSAVTASGKRWKRQWADGLDCDREADARLKHRARCCRDKWGLIFWEKSDG